MSSADPVAPALAPRAPRTAPESGVEVTCQVGPDGPDLAVVLLNLSPEGLGLLVAQPVPRGREVLLTFHEADKEGIARKGLVRWCRRVYENYCRIGIRLRPVAAQPEPLPPAPASAERTPPAAAAPSNSERRRSARAPAKGSARVNCWRGRIGSGADLALSLMDISRTGVRLMVNTRLQPLEPVTVSLVARGDAPVQRVGRVRWCVKTDWSYCVGIELDHPLDDSDLQRLS